MMEILGAREKRRAERHIEDLKLRYRVLRAGKGIGQVSLIDRIKDKFSGVGINISSSPGLGFEGPVEHSATPEEARQSVEEMLENLKVKEGE